MGNSLGMTVALVATNRLFLYIFTYAKIKTCCCTILESKWLNEPRIRTAEKYDGSDKLFPGTINNLLVSSLSRLIFGPGTNPFDKNSRAINRRKRFTIQGVPNRVKGPFFGKAPGVAQLRHVARPVLVSTFLVFVPTQGTERFSLGQ